MEHACFHVTIDIGISCFQVLFYHVFGYVSTTLCNQWPCLREQVTKENPTCRYGLVPNGGRVYYTERSQPPLLTQMVNLYYSVTGNKTFLEKMLPCLDDEHRFWIENRTVNVTSFPLNRYAADLTDPRLVSIVALGYHHRGGSHTFSVVFVGVVRSRCNHMIYSQTIHQ